MIYGFKVREPFVIQQLYYDIRVSYDIIVSSMRQKISLTVDVNFEY